MTGSGSCSGGSCNNSRQVTGPGGYSRTRQGQVSSNPDGGWTRNGTITRRNGNQVNYEGREVVRVATAYGGSRTGPYERPPILAASAVSGHCLKSLPIPYHSVCPPGSSPSARAIYPGGRTMLDMTNGLLPGLQSFGLQSGYRWLIPAVSTSLMILEYLLAQHILHDTRQTHDLRETAATFGVALVKGTDPRLDRWYRRRTVRAGLSIPAVRHSA